MQQKKKTKKTHQTARTDLEQRADGNRGLRKIWYLLLIPGIVAAVMLGRHLNKSKTPVSDLPAGRPTDDMSGYIDAQVCAGCHADVANSFHRTGMGRSLYRPSDSNRVEDYSGKNTIYNRRSDSYYVMLERSGTFYQRRYQIGPDGKKINIAEERVDYIVGSGDQARSYLHRDAENRLIELPVTWYNEHGGRWAMTPGYDQVHQSDFHGPISHGCFFCHDAYPRLGAAEKAVQSGEPQFPEKIPEGIDCQRCHGPGDAHVKAANNASSTEQQIRAAIVNPARLSRDRQLEICMECHLSTSGSQDDNVSRRFDRAIFSYRPGQPLADYKLYFDEADAEQHKDKFDIVDAAYRLSFSTCFRNSKMTCLTCHDPHVEEHGRASEASYVKVCESCHQKIRHIAMIPSSEDCISCHMPKRRSQYAVHIVLTDHYIQKNKPAGDLIRPLEEPEGMPGSHSDLVLFYPKQLANSAENLYVGAATLKIGDPDKNRIAHFQKQIEELKPEEAEFYAALGEAYLKTGDAQNAQKWLQEAHRRGPQYRPILEKLVNALFAQAKFKEAADLLKRELAAPPADSALLSDLGNAYARLGDFDEAENALKQAIATNPETAQAHNLLGLIALQRGNESDARKDFEEAIRLQPDLSEASVNLGKLSLGDQDLNRAEYFLKNAVALDGTNADAHHSYGLLLMLRKQYASSIRELKTAVSLDPNNSLIQTDLGDLLSQQGDQTGATRAYESALRIEPDSAPANLGLGLLLRRQGVLNESQRLCRIAAQSSEESIREAAQTCLK